MARLVALDRIGAAGLVQDVEASAAELGPIADRLMIPSVDQLRCSFRLKRHPGGVIEAIGALTAGVVQTCVVTLDEFAHSVAESFVIHFVPEGAESESDDPDAPDEIPYAGSAIDLGEAAIEQLALALDPYPRRPDLPEAPDDDDSEPHPFAALAGLRRPQ